MEGSSIHSNLYQRKKLECWNKSNRINKSRKCSFTKWKRGPFTNLSFFSVFIISVILQTKRRFYSSTIFSYWKLLESSIESSIESSNPESSDPASSYVTISLTLEKLGDKFNVISHDSPINSCNFLVN